MQFLKLIYRYTEKKLFLSLFLTCIFIICAALCSAALPIYLKKIIDQLAIHSSISSVQTLFIFYSITMILERFFNEVQFLSYARWENGIVKNAYKHIFNLLFFKDAKFFTENLHGAITSKIYQGITGLDLFMFDIVFKILPALIGSIFIISSIMIMFDFEMSLIIGIGVVFYCYMMHAFNTKIISYQNKVRNAHIHAQGVTTDLIGSWKDIKLTDSFNFANNILATTTQSITNTSCVFYRKRGMYGFLQALPICMIFITANYYVIAKYLSGVHTIGSILLINNYLLQILKPLESITLIFRNLTKNYSDFIAIEDITSIETGITNKQKCYTKNPPINNIILKNLTVDNILNNINLIINANDKIAIIGQSGSGKTTLLNAITGLNLDYKGDIFVNDVNTKNIPHDHIKHRIAYLPSDSRLIKETIKNNLLLGNDQDLTPALNFSCVNHKISSLENGVNTSICEHSSSLSSGEKQRLKLARTFLLDREIEIYDEATSALDPATEDQIINNILAKKNKIIIFISHKRQHLHKFTKVYQLENGHLKEVEHFHVT